MAENGADLEVQSLYLTVTTVQIFRKAVLYNAVILQ